MIACVEVGVDRGDEDEHRLMRGLHGGADGELLVRLVLDVPDEARLLHRLARGLGDAGRDHRHRDFQGVLRQHFERARRQVRAQ